MLAAGGKRDSRVVAFGGGSVGDVAGFAAGCFVRGVAFLQLPTTLLAQVDASIGGKTGINLPAAKNCVGLFHHPWATVAETGFLATLPRAELAAGLMEVVKAGVILDPVLFTSLETGVEPLLRGDATALGPVVARAAQAKIDVVERDPNERDLRRLLNFGHTLGHALEASLEYEALRHGEAVAYGMLFALRLAKRRGLDSETAARAHALICRFDLPELPAGLGPDELIERMRRDKKARESGLVWVLPTELGAGESTSEVDEKRVRRALERFLADPLAAP
jgi:3-dehydroquinate synthase